jgi:hypothetical protein
VTANSDSGACFAKVLNLQPGGRYAITGRSLAFPFLPMDKVEQFLLSLPTTDETSLVRMFRDWVRQNLARPS